MNVLEKMLPQNPAARFWLGYLVITSGVVVVSAAAKACANAVTDAI